MNYSSDPMQNLNLIHLAEKSNSYFGPNQFTNWLITKWVNLDSSNCPYFPTIEPICTKVQIDSLSCVSNIHHVVYKGYLPRFNTKVSPVLHIFYNCGVAVSDENRWPESVLILNLLLIWQKIVLCCYVNSKGGSNFIHRGSKCPTAPPTVPLLC